MFNALLIKSLATLSQLNSNNFKYKLFTVYFKVKVQYRKDSNISSVFQKLKIKLKIAQL